MLILAFSAAFTALVPLGLHAGQEEYKSHAGYVDIDWSKTVGDKEPSVQVFLESALLKLMASASKEIDPDVVGLVNDLSFVRVSVYEDLATESTEVAKSIDAQVKALVSKGWKSAVKVRQEKSESVDILVKVNGERIVGIAFFVAEPKELVFVNIAGNLDPEAFGAKLGKLAAKAAGGKIDLDLGIMVESIKNATKDESEKPKK
jgi:hypothetical protein